MELGVERRLKRERVSERYPTSVQLYKDPPVETIDLEEFEELANARLRLLQTVDNFQQKCVHSSSMRRGGEDYSRELRGILKSMPVTHKANAKREQVQMNRRRDHISHYILRLAYCKTEELRRWFISQELEVFRVRFLEMSVEERSQFFKLYSEDYAFSEPISGSSLDKMPVGLSPQEKYYKVPFTDTLDLVRTRQVVVNNGYAFVPFSGDSVVSIVSGRFRARLSEELVKTFYYLGSKEDERIAPILSHLKARYLGEDFKADSNLKGKIKLDQLNKLCVESYPPCMRHLHQSLCREHHLKHFGRLQYGLFLKSIGLSLEQALAFWRSEFTKKMDVERFDKHYSYNIRHSYGREGKRADYTAYSCMKIILTNPPSAGDHHGCPFRHWDEAHLQQMLVAHGLSQKGCREVGGFLSGREGQHYQLACQKYFELRHGIASAAFSLEHPTQFYLESRRIREGNGEAPDMQEESEGEEETRMLMDDAAMDEFVSEMDSQDMDT